jgi:hypothetical protein
MSSAVVRDIILRRGGLEVGRFAAGCAPLGSLEPTPANEEVGDAMLAAAWDGSLERGWTAAIVGRFAQSLLDLILGAAISERPADVRLEEGHMTEVCENQEAQQALPPTIQASPAPDVAPPTSVTSSRIGRKTFAALEQDSVLLCLKYLASDLEVDHIGTRIKRPDTEGVPCASLNCESGEQAAPHA